MLIKRFIVISGMMLISACSTINMQQPPAPAGSASAPVPGNASPPATASTSEPVFVPEPKAAHSSPAVIALLEDADSYQRQGDYKAAQSRIQRAQRISPRDPNVYYDLAKTHLQLEDYRLAEQVALKGLSYTQNDKSQLKRFWLLLADIRSAAGDRSAAQTARDNATRY